MFRALAVIIESGGVYTVLWVRNKPGVLSRTGPDPPLGMVYHRCEQSDRRIHGCCMGRLLYVAYYGVSL